MSERHVVAEGLAAAFLDGAWNHLELRTRGAAALGASPAWLVRLVKDVLRVFPEPPRERRSDLARHVETHETTRSAFEAPNVAPRVARVFVDAPAMGAARWDVPPIETPGDLAAWLGTDAAHLDWFADGKGLEQFSALNFRKTRIMRAGVRQRITGVVVNERPNVARADFDLLKATLHNCVRFGPESQNREARADFRAHLLGRVSFVAMIHPKRGSKLRVLFDRITWPK